MDSATRAQLLRDLRPKDGLNAFKNHKEFVEWTGQVAPLLNFNELYHANFITQAAAASHPKLSSNYYPAAFSQMEYWIVQAITELEHNLTPVSSSSVNSEPVISLASEHGIFWYLRLSHWKYKWQILVILLTVWFIGLLCGYNDFFRKLIPILSELWALIKSILPSEIIK